MEDRKFRLLLWECIDTVKLVPKIPGTLSGWFGSMNDFASTFQGTLSRKSSQQILNHLPFLILSAEATPPSPLHGAITRGLIFFDSVLSGFWKTSPQKFLKSSSLLGALWQLLAWWLRVAL